MYSGLWENRCFSCSIIKMWFFFFFFLVDKKVGILHLVLMLLFLAWLSSMVIDFISHGCLGDWLIPGARECISPKCGKKKPKTQTPKLKAIITSEIILQMTQWRSTRMVSIFKSHFILQLIQYVIGFSLALGSAGADLLWRLQEDSSGSYSRAVHTWWKSFSLQEQCLYVSSDIQFLC